MLKFWIQQLQHILILLLKVWSIPKGVFTFNDNTHVLYCLKWHAGRLKFQNFRLAHVLSEFNSPAIANSIHLTFSHNHLYKFHFNANFWSWSSRGHSPNPCCPQLPHNSLHFLQKDTLTSPDSCDWHSGCCLRQSGPHVPSPCPAPPDHWSSDPIGSCQSPPPAQDAVSVSKSHKPKSYWSYNWSWNTKKEQDMRLSQSICRRFNSSGMLHNVWRCSSLHLREL